MVPAFLSMNDVIAFKPAVPNLTEYGNEAFALILSGT
jgi:hypothetical protein